MTNQKIPQKYDLEERTAKFGEEVIGFAKIIPRNIISTPLISQFIRSGTAIGALYCEADDAESSKDFRHKLGICKKEARETKHWLRMIIITFPELKAKALLLWNEAKELNLIFNAIIIKINNKKYQKVEI